MSIDWRHHEIKWAERDRRRIETEAEMARRREEDRQRHIAIVERALDELEAVRGMPWVAAVAVDALLADGVVFARMGSWGEAE